MSIINIRSARKEDIFVEYFVGKYKENLEANFGSEFVDKLSEEKLFSNENFVVLTEDEKQKGFLVNFDYDKSFYAFLDKKEEGFLNKIIGKFKKKEVITIDVPQDSLYIPYINLENLLYLKGLVKYAEIKKVSKNLSQVVIDLALDQKNISDLLLDLGYERVSYENRDFLGRSIIRFIKK